LNDGWYYRPTGVGVEVCRDGGGFNVCFIQPSEWLRYTIDVPESAQYDVELRVATPHQNGRLYVELNGVDVSGPFTIPQTGSSWHVYQVVTVSRLDVPAGRQVIRIVFDRSGDGSPLVCNLDWIALRQQDMSVQRRR
jgi:hypothetical protein